MVSSGVVDSGIDMIFSVWAPGAKSVDLVLAERRIALRPVGEGHWQSDVEESDARQGYRYSLDGGAPMPDPRSQWQPAGVHGASFMLKAPAFHATTRGHGDFRAKPLSEAIIYELHVGTYTPEGTYVAAQEKLPHLVQLGVTHLELMPLATFPGRHGWGYDGVDLFAPFPAYGSPAELAAFVNACHLCGLAVLLDVVYNHVGPDGNYLGQFAPYFTDRYSTGWGAAVNYDGAQSDEVRRFVIDNALMWLRDYRFDGLRLDAVHAIFCFGAVHVLEELSLAVDKLGKELGRHFVLIAESDLNDPRLVRPITQGGYGLDAHWADDFHHAIHRYFTGEKGGYYADFDGLQDVVTALRDGYVYQGQYSAHRGRRHGKSPVGVKPHQLVVSAQNHDQIGNRARGERLSMMLDTQQQKSIAALTLLSPFVPLLFQGEEWGARTPFLYFTHHEDPELGRLVTEGRAREFSAFGWQGLVPDPQDLDTFQRSKLNWSELSAPHHAAVFQWYCCLVQLRRELALHREGSSSSANAVAYDAAADWLTLIQNGALAVFNLSNRAQRVPMPRGHWQLLLRSDSKDSTLQTDLLPARATFVYRSEVERI
jgi:maltooligosyltrehalose trehalohydrolase